MDGCNIAATQLVVGKASSQDNYSCIKLCNCIFFVNYHEHVKFLNMMNVACFMSMNSMYVNA